MGSIIIFWIIDIITNFGIFRVYIYKFHASLKSLYTICYWPQHTSLRKSLWRCLGGIRLRQSSRGECWRWIGVSCIDHPNHPEFQKSFPDKLEPRNPVYDSNFLISDFILVFSYFVSSIFSSDFISISEVLLFHLILTGRLFRHSTAHFQLIWE